MKTIIKMYITLLSPILAGVLNMIWCKLPILKKLQIPIDLNKNFIDKKRIFGDNKTYKGLVGYLILNILTSILCGFLYNKLNLNSYNYFYLNHDNTLLFNTFIGLLLGFGYSLFELPNSFLKRRFDIKPGKTIKGFSKYFFIFLDQADSVIGCCLVLNIFYKMRLLFFIKYVLLGALTHIVFNMILYFMHLRKNML